MPINFRDEKYFDVIKQHRFSKGDSLYTFNSDGCMWYATHDSDKISSYLLYMRSGIIEQCKIYQSNTEKYIPGQSMDEFLLYNIGDNLNALAEMGQYYPMAVFVNIVGAKGWPIFSKRALTPIDRNEIWIKECDLKCKPDKHERDLAPLLDAIWKYSGAARSPHIK